MKLTQVALATVMCSAAALSQEVRITTGVLENQVFQRNAERTADIPFGGLAIGKKVNGKNVEARLIGADGSALAGFDWSPVAKVVKQNWTARLKGVPTGGPYKLEARLQDSEPVAAVSNILVGDLWILAGQSNMEGHGDLIDVQPPTPLVHSYDMADRWIVAEDPLHTVVGAVDPVHWPLNADKTPERFTGEKLDRYISARKKGAGLGLPFAEEMLRRTGVPIGLVPCAHGGTSLEQWSPALKDRGGESLYGSMLRRFSAAGGGVKGILWYQGESDAHPKVADAYLHKFEDFVKSVRADFNQPDLPFYYVQIGRHIADSDAAEWNQVQLAQLKAESEMPHVGMVTSVDLSLDDGIHVSTPDLKRLGIRLALLASHDLFPTMKDFGDLKAGPRPAAAKFLDGAIKVSFSGVNGRLQSLGRISGFSIRTAAGEPATVIYKARVDPAEASTVILFVQGSLPERAVLWYGAGNDPYCNLHDASDMAVPAFAIPIE